MRRLLLACLASVLASSALAANDKSPADMTPAELFIHKAGQHALTGMETARVAQRRADNTELKSFSARMLAEHERLNRQIGELAASEGLEAPNQLDDEHATIVHSLSAKPASEFEAAFARQAREAHEEAVTLFEDASSIPDAQISAFAKKSLPMLRSHQQLVETLPGATPDASDRLSVAEGPLAPSPADVPPANEPPEQ